MIRQLIESLKNDLRNNPKFVKIFAGALVFVVMSAIAGMVIACWTPDAPDPKTASFEKIEGYLASKHYAEKSLSERKAYTAAVVERMEKKDANEQGGEIMKRLWGKNRNAATSVQVMAISQKMAPIASLSRKEQNQRINMMLNMAEMTQGRDKMKDAYNKMFGNKSNGGKNGLINQEAVNAMPAVMVSTTPAERRKMVRMMVTVKKQMDRRYGGQSATSQPAANK